MILMILINFLFILFLVLSLNKILTGTNENSILKHIGILEIGWIGFLFMFSLFLLFDLLEAKKDGQSLLEIAGAEKMMLFSIIGGFGIIHLSILGIIVLKLFKKRAHQS